MRRESGDRRVITAGAGLRGGEEGGKRKFFVARISCFGSGRVKGAWSLPWESREWWAGLHGAGRMGFDDPLSTQHTPGRGVGLSLSGRKASVGGASTSRGWTGSGEGGRGGRGPEAATHGVLVDLCPRPPVDGTVRLQLLLAARAVEGGGPGGPPALLSPSAPPRPVPLQHRQSVPTPLSAVPCPAHARSCSGDY